jgi:hypothetical protein
MKYDDNIQKARAILSESHVIAGLLARVARTKKLGYYASCHSELGSQSSDVYSWIDLSVWSRCDLAAYLGAARDWILDLFRYRSLSFQAETFPFVRTWCGWVWAAHSLESATTEAANRLAKDRIFMEFGRGWARKSEARQKFDLYNEEYERTLTRKKTIDAIETMGYMRVSDTMWVSEKDPTCFYYDQEKAPYDCQKGWSEFAVGGIVDYWMSLFYPEVDYAHIDVEREDPSVVKAKLMSIAAFLERNIPWLK